MSEKPGLNEAITCTLEDVIGWCEGEPETSEYDPGNSLNCLMARYLEAQTGARVYVGDERAWALGVRMYGAIPLPDWMRELVIAFDALFSAQDYVSRAEALAFLRSDAITLYL
jgi:hypothetical protein